MNKDMKSWPLYNLLEFFYKSQFNFEEKDLMAKSICLSAVTAEILKRILEQNPDLLKEKKEGSAL